ncbi:MAG: hypothetical protein GY683_03960, partial [Moraxella sp.]|nr:hypothetical protein [Moraxella sp.]
MTARAKATHHFILPIQSGGDPKVKFTFQGGSRMKQILKLGLIVCIIVGLVGPFSAFA